MIYAITVICVNNLNTKRHFKYGVFNVIIYNVFILCFEKIVKISVGINIDFGTLIIYNILYKIVIWNYIYMGGIQMQNNVRPESMERINTPELAEAFINEQVALVREQVGDKKVLLALSGGVDSSVVAALLIKAIGKQLVCVHVNHGLMRKGESEEVIEVFRNQLDANLIYIDATDRFLDLLSGVEEPETKRKIIGGEFIKVFDEEASKLEGISFLAQGTIYPDILESDGVKAHHNVGGLPEDMQFELVEPVRLLYKDEVRVVGKA